MNKRPSFVFIMTDQHRADWLSCAGHNVVKTPHLDALAANGIRFENFYTASPVCMPNRASFMIGRYPSVHGLRYNGCALPASANTFVDVLSASGYKTAAIGKSHLQPFSDNPPDWAEVAETGPIEDAWKLDSTDYTQEEPMHYEANGRFKIKLPYYGFQYIDMVTGHGDRCGGHYQQWFRQNVTNWQELQDRNNQLPHQYTCPQAYRTPVPEDLYSTAYIRDRSLQYLKKTATCDEPFFLFISFPDPHHPFNPPGKYWDMYKPEDFDLAVPYGAHKNPTPPMQWLYKNWKSGGGQKSPQTAMMIDERQLQEAMALTAGMITCIDDAVGDLMAALKDLDIADNTVVAFNADHGDYLGDFNMLLKGSLPFRSITQVPFIWSDPNGPSGTTSNQLVSTVDLPLSILERAGVKPYFGTQGKSFLPHLNAGSAPTHEAVLIEYNDSMPRLGFDNAPRVRTLASKEWRYTVYADQKWGELYHLQTDRRETNNLWDNPNYSATRAQFAERMTNHLIHQMDESPRSTRRA